MADDDHRAHDYTASLGWKFVSAGGATALALLAISYEKPEAIKTFPFLAFVVIALICIVAGILFLFLAFFNKPLPPPGERSAEAIRKLLNSKAAHSVVRLCIWVVFFLAAGIMGYAVFQFGRASALRQVAQSPMPSKQSQTAHETFRNNIQRKPTASPTPLVAKTSPPLSYNPPGGIPLASRTQSPAKIDPIGRPKQSPRSQRPIWDQSPPPSATASATPQPPVNHYLDIGKGSTDTLVIGGSMPSSSRIVNNGDRTQVRGLNQREPGQPAPNGPQNLAADTIARSDSALQWLIEQQDTAGITHDLLLSQMISGRVDSKEHGPFFFRNPYDDEGGDFDWVQALRDMQSAGIVKITKEIPVGWDHLGKHFNTDFQFDIIVPPNH